MEKPSKRDTSRVDGQPSSRSPRHALPDDRLPAGLMIMSRLEAGGPEEHERTWRSVLHDP